MSWLPDTEAGLGILFGLLVYAVAIFVAGGVVVGLVWFFVAQ